MKIQKNNVSYFRAGFIAGLVEAKKYTRKELDHLFYTTVEWPNKMIDKLREYEQETEEI